MSRKANPNRILAQYGLIIDFFEFVTYLEINNEIDKNYIKFLERTAEFICEGNDRFYTTTFLYNTYNRELEDDEDKPCYADKFLQDANNFILEATDASLDIHTVLWSVSW